MQLKIGKYAKILCNLLKKIYYVYNIQDGAFIKKILTFDTILSITIKLSIYTSLVFLIKIIIFEYKGL